MTTQGPDSLRVPASIAEAATVSIMIATHNRAVDLQQTLQQAALQKYAQLELLVIDDGSQSAVVDLVLQMWPNARCIRHDTAAGQCRRRNEGFHLAKGGYVLQLDDDCSLIRGDEIQRGVEVLESEPETGAVTFFVHNGPDLPSQVCHEAVPGGYIGSFLGACVLFRRSALLQTMGYREFFGNEFEEEELALQLLSRGWRIRFLPEVLVHHRVSTQARDTRRTWMRGLRNRLWALLIHMPMSRLPLEFAWKVGLGAWDACRLCRPFLFIRALGQFVSGAAFVWALRSPLHSDALRVYDAFRVYSILSKEQVENPPKIGLSALALWWRRWKARARGRSSWDGGEGGKGKSATMSYAHELDGQEARRRGL
jgi:GT2 family glycosyltransferase